MILAYWLSPARSTRSITIYISMAFPELLKEPASVSAENSHSDKLVDALEESWLSSA